MRTFLFGFILFSFVTGFHTSSLADGGRTGSLKDPGTRQFYENLKQTAQTGVLFGMANPTTISYKGGPKNDKIDQSDCKDITGSHPAFHESDFIWYRDSGGKAFMESDLKALKEARDRGALIGYCWHLWGNDSQEFYAREDGEFTEDQDFVKRIVKGSQERSENPSLDWLLSLLDEWAIPVFREIETPVLFRPFHEMNGDWF